MLSEKNRSFQLLVSLTLLFLTTITSTSAQEKVDSVKAKKSYFKLSISYLSNAVYLGRKDTFALPYITPSLLYKNKSGFYLEGSLSYSAAPDEQQINSESLEAGYEFSNRNKKLSGYVYGAKYFNNATSTAVNSQVKGALGSTISYDFNVVSLEGGADVFFSQNPDAKLSLQASHDFYLGQNYNWTISPSALMNAGTENFYDDYFTNKKYTIKRKRRLVALQSKVIVLKNNFSVLDYEFSVPVQYDKKKFGLFITPTYAVPVNPIQYSLNNGVTYRTENLTNTFYIETGVYLKF